MSRALATLPRKTGLFWRQHARAISPMIWRRSSARCRRATRADHPLAAALVWCLELKPSHVAMTLVRVDCRICQENGRVAYRCCARGLRCTLPASRRRTRGDRCAAQPRLARILSGASACPRGGRLGQRDAHVQQPREIRAENMRARGDCRAARVVSCHLYCPHGHTPMSPRALRANAAMSGLCLMCCVPPECASCVRSWDACAPR